MKISEIQRVRGDNEPWYGGSDTVTKDITPMPGNPEYGGGLRRFIFSQIEQDNLEFLQEEIQNKISVNFPNIILEKLQVLESPDNNTVTVNITYSIPNTGINDQLELNFN